MSGAAQGSTNTTKATVSDANNTEKPLANEQKPAAQLEEDDEFEDFPMEDWSQEEAMPGGTTHLWEESWDDDETNEDFSAQLKEELKKVNSGK